MSFITAIESDITKLFSAVHTMESKFLAFAKEVIPDSDTWQKIGAEAASLIKSGGTFLVQHVNLAAAIQKLAPGVSDPVATSLAAGAIAFVNDEFTKTANNVQAALDAVPAPANPSGTTTLTSASPFTGAQPVAQATAPAAAPAASQPPAQSESPAPQPQPPTPPSA